MKSTCICDDNYSGDACDKSIEDDVIPVPETKVVTTTSLVDDEIVVPEETAGGPIAYHHPTFGAAKTEEECKQHHMSNRNRKDCLACVSGGQVSSKNAARCHAGFLKVPEADNLVDDYFKDIADEEIIPAQVEDKCQDILSHNDDIEAVWNNEEKPDWKRCLSCDGAKPLGKVKKGNKCALSACESILKDDGTPLCHKVKFAFNAGVWQEGAQFDFHYKPQCVPCIPAL